MGKKNSKLKQDTIDRLTTDTYCEYCHTNISICHISLAAYSGDKSRTSGLGPRVHMRWQP